MSEHIGSPAKGIINGAVIGVIAWIVMLIAVWRVLQ